MNQEETPRKRLRVDDSYVSSPSPSPIRFGAKNGDPNPNAIVIYDPVPVKREPVSLNELVTSRTVAINVGPEQTNVNVSASLFQGISEPLHRLLNSVAAIEGDVSEVNRFLQYDDKDAFLQLVSMAYNTILKGRNDGQLGKPLTIEEESPSKTLLEIDTSAPQLVKCRDCVKGNIWLDVRCDSPKAICKAPRLSREYGLQSFFELQFAQSHNVVACILSKYTPYIPDPVNNATGKPYPLIHFAKVFNLAAKWQVDGLQHTSLLGFQNRLKRYVKAGPDEKTLEELLDVLRYLASTIPFNKIVAVTKATEPEGTGTEHALGISTLLKSLMRYICVHVSALLQDIEFRQIVAENGVIGLMLFEILDDTMIASKGDD